MYIAGQTIQKSEELVGKGGQVIGTIHRKLLGIAMLLVSI